MLPQFVSDPSTEPVEDRAFWPNNNDVGGTLQQSAKEWKVTFAISNRKRGLVFSFGSLCTTRNSIQTHVYVSIEQTRVKNSEYHSAISKSRNIEKWTNSSTKRQIAFILFCQRSQVFTIWMYLFSWSVKRDKNLYKSPNGSN